MIWKISIFEKQNTVNIIISYTTEHVHCKNGQKNNVDILVIEDQQIVLLGLSTLLSTCEGITRIDKATTAEDAISKVRKHAFDILIIDIELPDMSGFDLLERLRDIHPAASVIFHSMHEEFWIIKQMMNSGADAIVLKSDDISELRRAVEQVMAGGRYYSSRYKEYCIAYEKQQPLTSREQDVLKAISEGKQTTEIAEALFVSANTVEFHRKRLLCKLEASNMAELVNKAMKRGYIK